MITIYYILVFAAGVTLGAYVTYKFRKPTNQYNGSVKIKQKGQNNELTTEVKSYIATTKPKQFRKDRRIIKKES